MRATKWVPGIWVAGVLLLAGCGKSQPPGPPQMNINGVKVDVPKLQLSFTTGKPDLQIHASKAATAIRYGQYPEALAELANLAADPDLTEPQKKVVNDVTEQVKQAMTANPKPSK